MSELHLHVGGLYHPEPAVNANLSWVDLWDIQPGDEIVVRIVESEEADKPASEKRTTDDEIREQQRRYYESAKEQFETGG